MSDHQDVRERDGTRTGMWTSRAEYGSDLIVDLFKAYRIEYAALNPGATFRGLHDSIVNYGGNTMPQMILCNHEEIASMAFVITRLTYASPPHLSPRN